MSEAVDFDHDGARHFGSVLRAAELERLRQAADLVHDSPGVRLTDEPLGRLLRDGEPGRIARALTSDRARPVRAVMFDKNASTNWSLGWHQDRTIVVRRRIETQGFGPWTTKHGLQHVAPPFEVMSRLLTLRLHVDPVDATNAPLRIALGSHRLGFVAATQAAEQAGDCDQLECLADAGDVWAYRTLILHASERASGDRRRRVLQVDYADFDLPGELEWLGV